MTPISIFVRGSNSSLTPILCYSLAVQEAYKAVDKYVGNKVGATTLTGTQLMEAAFSPTTPILYWTERKTPSEADEQRGYQRLFAGAMLGIRNPVTHEFNWVDNPELALELIVFAQHLVRKAKAAQVAKRESLPPRKVQG